MEMLLRTKIAGSCTGDGPVDALFNAIERALSLNLTIESYQVRSVTSGREALGEAIVRIRSGEKSYTGRGVSTDVIEASGQAYVQAINQKMKMENEAVYKKNDSLNSDDGV
jgi:2-isopropylmalate synthase